MNSGHRPSLIPRASICDATATVAVAADSGTHEHRTDEPLPRLLARLHALECENNALRNIALSEDSAIPPVALLQSRESGSDFTGMAAPERLQSLARFVHAMDTIDREISSSQAIDTVHREICQICVEGGFALAWLGIVDSEKQRIEAIQIAVASGTSEMSGASEASETAAEYLAKIQATDNLDVALGLEPGVIAWRGKMHYLCNDIEALPASHTWSRDALAAGLRSVIALPVYRAGKPYAVLTAYGALPGFLDAATVGFFETLVDCSELMFDKFDLKAQQRLLAENLCQSEARFWALAESLPLKIFIKDTASKYVSCNTMFAHDLGLLPEALTGKSDFDLHTPAQARQFCGEDQHIITTGQMLDLHASARQDGIEKIVHVIKAPFRNATGQIAGVIGTIIDITERKEAECRLRRFAYELEALYQNAPCGYCAIDTDGFFRRINNTALQWLGYRPEEVVGRLELFDVISETSRKPWMMALAELKKTGMPQKIRLQMIRKDGCILPVVLDTTAIHDEQGDFVSSQVIISDVSMLQEFEREQRRYACRLDELSHRLVAAQENERRRLASELHDCITPNLVAVKLSLANLLAGMSGPLPDVSQESFDDIRAMLEDTIASVRDICTELRPPLLDYSGLIPALESYAQQIGRRTGVAIDVDARMEGASMGSNTESLLFRIVQEAVANAIKHASAHSIHIHLQGGRREMMLSIKDDGVGFAPLSLGNTDVGGGAAIMSTMPGLGLITMKERAEFAGGQLAIHSQPGGGTEVRVDFTTMERRATFSRRHTDPPHADRRLPDAMNARTRPFSNEFFERRNTQCRRRPEAAFDPQRTPITPPGFIERRSGKSRRLHDRSETASAASFHAH